MTGNGEDARRQEPSGRRGKQERPGARRGPDKRQTWTRWLEENGVVEAEGVGYRVPAKPLGSNTRVRTKIFSLPKHALSLATIPKLDR